MPVFNLDKLTVLNLSKNSLYTDISNISKLTGLVDLDLSESEFNMNFSKIVSLKNLKNLNINKSKLVQNVQVQSDGFMTSIYYDKKEWDKILSYLEQVPNLEYLSVSNDKVSKLDFVKSLPKLKYLDAQSNYITDIGAVTSLNHLEFLNLTENPIKDSKKLQMFILKHHIMQ